MATLAVLRPFTSSLRPSTLLFRLTFSVPVRYASKTPKVASKAAPETKLPASISKKSFTASPASVTETGTFPKTPKPRRATKTASKTEAAQATTSVSVTPSTTSSHVAAPPVQPAATPSIVPVCTIEQNVPKIANRTSFWGSFVYNPDFSHGAKGPPFKKNEKACDAVKKTSTSARPPMQSARSRGYSPIAAFTTHGLNGPVIYQYFCQGPVCHAQLYSSSILPETAARRNRFGLEHLAVAAGSASLGGLTLLGTLAAMSKKSAYNADETVKKEPKRLV